MAVIKVDFDVTDIEEMTWRIVRKEAHKILIGNSADKVVLTRLALATPETLKKVMGLGAKERLSDNIIYIIECKSVAAKLVKAITSDYE
jgi:hypothetical protein